MDHQTNIITRVFIDLFSSKIHFQKIGDFGLVEIELLFQQLQSFCQQIKSSFFSPCRKSRVFCEGKLMTDEPKHQ